MAEKERKKIEDKIKDIKSQIISNSKDAEWTKKLLSHLTTYQKQADVEPVELIVPCKEVKETIDYGACKISRTIRGYLFEAKGGLYTFVGSRMQSVCGMLQTLFDLHNKEDKDEDETIIYDNAHTAIEYVFQSPIFASLNEKSLFEIATAILKTFNDYAHEHYTNAEAVDETEEDIKANVEFENMGHALETLANDPLPPEDKEE